MVDHFLFCNEMILERMGKVDLLKKNVIKNWCIGYFRINQAVF